MASLRGDAVGLLLVLYVVEKFKVVKQRNLIHVDHVTSIKLVKKQEKEKLKNRSELLKLIREDYL